MNSIDKNDILNALESGIKRGKRKRRIKKVININLLALVIIMMAFSVSVNVSSAFASSLKDIPVIGKIAEFVRIGSGFKNVAERGYYSKGDILIDDGNFIISVEGYYFSDSDINIVISLDGALKEETSYNFNNVRIFDTDMKKLSGYSLGYGPFGGINGCQASTITVSQKEGLLPGEIIIMFDITERTQNVTEFIGDGPPADYYDDFISIYSDISVNLNKQTKLDNIVKTLDKSFEVNDISIKLKDLIITPVTMDMTLSIDSDSMSFYGFRKMHFKSDADFYYGIANGLSRTINPLTFDYIYFFNSSYFDGEIPLTLVIDGIYALPKDNSTVIIDVEEGRIIKSIDDRLTFEGIDDSSDEYFYIFFSGTANEVVEFAQYNDHAFKETMISSGKERIKYTLKCEKKYINDSKVEISFWNYPNEIKFYKEIIISE